MWDDEELAEEIGPWIISVLNERQFFQKLEQAVFSDTDESRCTHSYDITFKLLTEEGFDVQEREDMLSVFHHRGGCCDCEILYNVDERDAGRKAKYWRKQAEEQEVARLKDHA